MEFMFSEKGTKLLIIDNYKFGFQKNLADNIQRWICTKRKCKAYVKLNGDCLCEEVLTHNHESENDGTLVRQQLTNSLKRKCDELITERPSKIIRKEIASNSHSESLLQNDINRVRKNLNAAKLRTIPKLPSNLEELHKSVSEYSLITNLGENFIYDNDSVNNIITFTCTQNLEQLKKATTVFVDGTFKSCPKQFYQLFSIFIKVQNSYVPVVFSLLPNKTTDTYILALHKVAKYLTVGTVFVDFETAIHSAITSQLQQVTVRGCRFHLCQSWWRKIQQFGLSNEFKDNASEIEQLLKLFFGLPLLSPEDVEDCFYNDLMAIKPYCPKLDQFFDYVHDTYIMSDSIFPPKIWARFDKNIDRTTNCCESFHSKLNKEFTTAHPNIFYFMETLNSIQTLNYIKFRSNNTRKLTSKQEKNNKFLENCMTEYTNEKLTRIEYLKKVCFKFANQRF
ncbi:uncharacterized protein LOC111029781 [Myzus persicae]|uniref:uncharacterized protein LOC111029781 n=1 Tax=Myzus persicae TaxID=13164 RepID=UPI000B939EC3|nr:uncharacterized protein LOC111029781 [Myzus persicae]